MNKCLIRHGALYSIFFAAWAAGLIIFGCGGSGGGGGSDEGPGGMLDVGGTVYNSAAVIGDLAKYQVNLASLKYSYLFVEGSLKDIKANGTMDGITALPRAYNLTREGQASPGARLVINENKIIAVDPAGNGLLAGVSEVSGGYSVSEVAGLYNCIVYGVSPGETMPSIEIGSLQLSAGAWSWWDSASATNAPVSTPDGLGTWTQTQQGVVYVMDGDTKIANAMVMPGAGGAEVMVLDFCADLKGIGLCVYRADASTVSGAAYDVVSSDDDGVFAVTLNGATIDDGGTPEGLTLDQPWQGFMRSDSGVYLLTDPTADILFGGTADVVLIGVRE